MDLWGSTCVQPEVASNTEIVGIARNEVADFLKPFPKGRICDRFQRCGNVLQFVSNGYGMSVVL